MLPEHPGPNGQRCLLVEMVQAVPRLRDKGSLLENLILTTASALAKTKVRSQADPIAAWIKVSIVPLSGEQMSIQLDWQQNPVY